MARYIVEVSSDGRTASILVVLSPSALVSALRDKIIERLPNLKIGVNSSNVELTMHLGVVDGPIIDQEDLLSDAIEDPKLERIHAVVYDQSTTSNTTTHNAPNRYSDAQKQSTGKPLKVRVITPELARSHPDVAGILLLPEGAITFDTTLEELKAQVKRHLGLPFEIEQYEEFDCNCALARQIDVNATFNESSDGAMEALSSLIAVYGRNEVACIPVTNITREALESAAKKHLETHAAGRHLSVIGGLQATSSGQETYIKLPVFAFCSQKRHGAGNRTVQSARSVHAVPPTLRSFILDLHTSEMSIEITAHNARLTLSDTGLEDCTINGILNIFAVKRYAPREGDVADPRGKDAIFQQNEAWEHPLGQSERGLANLLSTLRIFASITHASKMESPEQDAVLHVFYLLTRFPPAVRAMHVLMVGKSPSRAEQAALAQAVYEILKTIVPLHAIRSDSARLFEGSRLLFGLLLEKAKHLKVSMHSQDAGLAYINSRTVEIRNMRTMEPVARPVQTISGLVDCGLYNAFKENDGMLRWSDGTIYRPIASIDRKLSRAALLSGGIKEQIVIFDIDAANITRRYVDHGKVERVISAAEYSDLQYLATLCCRNRLEVVHPSALPSAEAPVLTLDRQGLLAVYVGRQPCSEAGRDITLFRPTNDPTEESVDVSIITQLLVSIIDRRTADGTAVFESFGDQHRQLKDPEEVLMLVLDCSASMDRRCGFIDVEENEDAYDFDSTSASSLADEHDSEEGEENFRYERPILDDMKAFLSTHESFVDMLAIVRCGTTESHREINAEKVMTILRGLAEQEIQAKAKELENIRLRGTNYYYRRQAENIERDLAILKNRSIRLHQYKDALAAFLIYRAENASIDDVLVWNISDGNTVPQVPKQADAFYDLPEFEIPRDYLCPISSEIFSDPVTTVDGFTYDRINIERWFQTHDTSPCTNVVLESKELVPNVVVKESVNSWIKGETILSGSDPSYTSGFTVTFKSPLDQWVVQLPATTNVTVGDMYELAFRGTKGRYSEFELHHSNTFLLPSEELVRPYLGGDCVVIITPMGSNATQSTGDNFEQLCLVKVYCGSYADPVTSYWERKTTSKTLGSVVFRYYRQAFLRNAWTVVGAPFVLWTGLKDKGDSSLSGWTRNHWDQLSNYFTREHSKGRLAKEFAYATEDDTNDVAIRTGQSQPLVFKIELGSPPRRKNRKTLSRLEVLVQMFEAYVNRILAYNFQTHIGLVTVRSKASLTQAITHSIENFRHQLNNITAEGDTACWDAIALARDQLLAYKDKYSKAKLRILCLSDGEDNKSKLKAHEVSMQLMKDHIVLDSFCLGDEENMDLKTLAFLTGGYKFQPSTLEQAMAICELEPVLSQLERPDVVLPPQAKRYLSVPASRFQRAKNKFAMDVVSRDVFPKRKEHPGLSESFVELGAFARKFNLANRTDNNLRQTRILSELRNSGAKPHPHYDIYVRESDFSLWKIVMQGPPDSSYATGTFMLYLDMGEQFPLFAPSGRFITPVYHPNINAHGRVCHSIFDRNWTVDTTIKDVLDSVYSLLLVPEFSDPINAVVTLNFHWDEVQFKEEVVKQIQKHAMKKRAEWKKEIVG